MPMETDREYSALEREKTLLCAVTQKSLENTMLQEISQSQRTDTVGDYLHEVPRVLKSIETERGWWLLGLGEARWGVSVYWGQRFSLGR